MRRKKPAVPVPQPDPKTKVTKMTIEFFGESYLMLEKIVRFMDFLQEKGYECTLKKDPFGSLATNVLTVRLHNSASLAPKLVRWESSIWFCVYRNQIPGKHRTSFELDG